MVKLLHICINRPPSSRKNFLDPRIPYFMKNVCAWVYSISYQKTVCLFTLYSGSWKCTIIWNSKISKCEIISEWWHTFCLKFQYIILRMKILPSQIFRNRFEAYFHALFFYGFIHFNMFNLKFSIRKLYPV